MKEKIVRPHSRTFRGYMVSYIGVVLIALALLSIMASRQIALRMSEEGIRVTQNKLYTIVEELESQFLTMRNIAVEIASLEEFSPSYFAGDKYREIELLKSLKKYRSSGFISEYFLLKFEENENIFTAEGTTMPLELYLKSHMKLRDDAVAVSFINQLCKDTEESFSLYKTEDTPTLFCFPLGKYALSGKREGVLCFEVTEKELQLRMEKVAGELEGNMALYYDGILIYGMEQAGSPLQRESDDGRLKVLLWPEPESYFSWDNVLSADEWLLFLVMTLILFGIAVLAAWKSYRPIRDIAQKYGSISGGDSVLELEGIDMLIDTLIRKDEKNNMLLQQYEEFREQTVHLIAEGGYAEWLRERLPMLNLHLDMPLFCRITCEFDRLDRREELSQQLYRDVEELSDDGGWLYPYWSDNDGLKVLAAISEEYQAEEAVDALQALFEACGISAKVFRTVVCHDIGQLGHTTEWDGAEEEAGCGGREGEQSDSSCMAEEIQGAAVADWEFEEKNVIQEENSVSNNENRVSKENGKKSSIVIQAIEYIEKNCTRYDLSLDMVAREFHITSAYLCRLIKQQTGVNYKDYLTNLRIAAAKEMLKDKEASVSDVCQRTGYTNVSHFIKIFQKAEGVTPAKYRNEQVENHS